MIRGRRSREADGITGLLYDTERLVSELLRENKELKARNQKLSRELDRLSAGWSQIKKLARAAPRVPRKR